MLLFAWASCKLQTAPESNRRAALEFHIVRSCTLSLSVALCQVTTWLDLQEHTSHAISDLEYLACNTNNITCPLRIDDACIWDRCGVAILANFGARMVKVDVKL
ncbi:hypothetical protein K0M31_015634 [Melipona bicolor]|uniref:Uncharacterized protein n=1 Tax=Melipona bicolor TaxID=60889 RepID=A0AA40FES6_9HYME|nr:hypothetical protein K0M31_015634 [Melipona bicolor]